MKNEKKIVECLSSDEIEDKKKLDNYLKIDDNNLEEYMRSNLFYLKFFFALHDHRIFPTKANWYKKGTTIEEYIKNYVNNLAIKHNTSQMKLTTFEQETNWEIKQDEVITNDKIKIKLLTIKSWIKNNNNKSWVVIVHGLNSHKFKSVFFGLIYLRLGYNILVYDQRNHGESSKTQTSMGEKEKYDLLEIIKYLFNNFKIKQINFHGWSMGTFVIGDYLKKICWKNKKVGWVVLDSTITLLQELYFEYMNKNNKYYTTYYAVRRYAIENKGYDPNNITPGINLNNVANIPYLYILNKKDHLTPYNLGQKAYKNKIKWEKKIKSNIITFECDHVRAIMFNTNKYIESITNFINEN